MCCLLDTSGEGVVRQGLWCYMIDFHVTNKRGKVLGYRNLSVLRRRPEPVMLRWDRRIGSDQLSDPLTTRQARSCRGKTQGRNRTGNSGDITVFRKVCQVCLGGHLTLLVFQLPYKKMFYSTPFTSYLLFWK